MDEIRNVKRKNEEELKGSRSKVVKSGGGQIPLEYQRCCVGGCNDWKTDATSLHPIPNHSAVVQIKWYSFIRRSRGDSWTPKDDHNIPLVCSLHFFSSRFVPGTNNLKLNAVPREDVITKSRGGAPQKESRVGNLPIIPPLSRSVTRTMNQSSLRPAVEGKSKPQVETDNNKEKSQDLPTRISTNPVPLAADESLQPMNSSPIVRRNESKFRKLLKSPTNNPLQVFAVSPDAEGRSKLVTVLTNSLASNKLHAASSTTIPIIVSHSPQSSTKFIPAGNPNSSHISPSLSIRSGPRIVKKVLHANDGTGHSSAPVILLSNASPSVVTSPILTNLDSFKNKLSNKSDILKGNTFVTEPSKSGFSFTMNSPSERFVPNEISFCIVCGSSLNPEHIALIQQVDKQKARDLLTKFLNIHVKHMEEVNGDHPICPQCNYKVLDLQNTLNQLIKVQSELERQRNDLLKEIVRTFCRRSGPRNGVGQFAAADSVHELITKKWASQLTPPFQSFEPAWDPVDINLAKQVANERKAAKRKRRQQQQMSSLEKRISFYDRLKERQEKQLLEKNRTRSKSREKVQCTICSLVMQRISLKNHMLIHNGEAHHCCSVCDKTFLRMSNLKAHEITHRVGTISFGPTGRRFQCQYCDYIAQSGKSYFQHVASTHLTSPEKSVTEKREETVTFYDCDGKGCNLSISKLEEFQRHLHSHSKDPITCTECFKQFAMHSNLMVHQGLHSSRPASTFHDCPYCQLAFASESEVSCHVASSHRIQVDVEALKFVCAICSTKFVTASQLKSHTQNVHRKSSLRLGGEKRRYQLYMCEACGEIFHAESRLKMHAYKHSHPEGFTCEECHKIFPDPTRLWFHKKRKHFNQPGTESQEMRNSDELIKDDGSLVKPRKFSVTSRAKNTLNLSKTKKRKQYECKHCKYVSKSSTNLFRRHLLVIHPDIYLDDKPYICHVCWKNFESNDELQQHCTAHDKNKCTVCSRYFGDKTKLALHTRIHTGEKPYKCQFCPKSFSLETNLREHENRHTGNRPHTCLQCKKGFFRKQRLLRHMNKVHPQKQIVDNSSLRNEIPSQLQLVALGVLQGTESSVLTDFAKHSESKERSKPRGTSSASSHGMPPSSLISVDFSNFDEDL